MSSKISVVPYDRELLKNFVYDGIESKVLGSQIIPMMEFYAKLGPVFVGLTDDKVIGIGGLYSLWNNAASCFLFLNKEVEQYKKSVFKILLEFMAGLIKKYNIKSLIVECVDDNVKAHSLIGHLGFKKDKTIKIAWYSRGV